LGGKCAQATERDDVLVELLSDHELNAIIRDESSEPELCRIMP
jgi:hypothetical protein